MHLEHGPWSKDDVLDEAFEVGPDVFVFKLMVRKGGEGIKDANRKRGTLRVKVTRSHFDSSPNRDTDEAN